MKITRSRSVKYAILAIIVLFVILYISNYLKISNVESVDDPMPAGNFTVIPGLPKRCTCTGGYSKQCNIYDINNQKGIYSKHYDKTCGGCDGTHTTTRTADGKYWCLSMGSDAPPIVPKGESCYKWYNKNHPHKNPLENCCLESACGEKKALPDGPIEAPYTKALELLRKNPDAIDYLYKVPKQAKVNAEIERGLERDHGMI